MLNGQSYALESVNQVYPAHWVCTGDTLLRDTLYGGPLYQIGGYWITCHEITIDLWDWYTGHYPSERTGDKRPVTNVTRAEVEEVCQIIERSCGQPWRLPTREEWLFAFKGGLFTEGYRYAGSNDAGNVAWHRGNSRGTKHWIGQRIANELALHDMSGNVAEMVLEGDSVVLLGGSYLDPPLPIERIDACNPDPEAVGFRLVCTAPLWFDESGSRVFR